MMLQDKLYPKWAVRPRKWWNKGYRRIIVFWAITFAAFFIVLLVIATGILILFSIDLIYLICQTGKLSTLYLSGI